ncbi:hypothetical protein IH981_02935, partial [Patescibacteria group bacterium]|nr:hypothetical protein [Patescibacteria group bacterium]
FKTGSTIYCGVSSETHSGYAVFSFGSTNSAGNRWVLGCKQVTSISTWIISDNGVTETFKISSVSKGGSSGYWTGTSGWNTGFSVTNGSNKSITLTWHDRPDLVIRNSSGGTSPAISGSKTVKINQNVTYEAKTKNIGDGGAGGSTTRAWTTGSSNNADNFSIGSLSAGAISAKRSFTTSWSSPGTYTVSFKADNGGVITEASEGNNTSSITVTVTGKPDLVIRNKDGNTNPSISGPTTIVAGVSGTYITRTRNRGEVTAAASTTRASTSGSSNNTQDYSIGSLAPDQNSATRSFTTSWNEPGTFTVSFKADKDNVVVESSEGNNTASLTVHVTGADLVIRNESGVTKPSISGPTTAFVGIDATFTFVTKNIGVLPAAASTTRAWTNNSSNNSDEYSISSLTPGTIHSIHSFTTSWSAPGNYTVHAMADNGGVVAEGNENNNSASIAVVISVLKPVECAINADPSKITIDDRKTTITAKDLDPGRQYRFVLSNTNGVVYTSEIKTPDENGTVTYIQSFQYVDGSGDITNLPLGDYLIHYSPIDDPILKCVANVTLFSVTFVDEPPEVILPTPFGPVCGTAICLSEAFLNTSLGIVGGAGFFLMVFGSYRLMFSGGNPESVKSGREIITAAIIGLIFVTLAVFILNLIGISILGLNI